MEILGERLMNDYSYNESNRVFLMGSIVSGPVFSHEMYGEGFCELIISVPRLSDHKDLLPITISERLMETCNFKIGSTIAINGQFRSYNKIIDGKSKLMLTVFVRELFSEPNESQNPNSIELIGYVCKSPIYRTTPFNREICDVLVAVNRAYNKSDYIPCIAWGRNAKYVSQAKIGQKISLNGRIQSREYAKKISEEIVETKIAYEISISKVYFEDESKFIYNRDTDSPSLVIPTDKIEK